MSTEQQQIPFITDDLLADRLRQVQDALTDIGYRLSVLARELGELRRLIEPRDESAAAG